MGSRSKKEFALAINIWCLVPAGFVFLVLLTLKPLVSSAWEPLQTFRPSSSPSDSQGESSASEQHDEQGSCSRKAAAAEVAVLLVGQLRQFEMSAPSQLSWIPRGFHEPAAADAAAPSPVPPKLLQPLMDAFLVTPFDENNYKMSLLDSVAGLGSRGRLRLVSALLFHDYLVNASAYPGNFITGLGGKQGALQLFEMERLAWQHLQAWEERVRGGARYTWVMKLRPDAFWVRPPASLADIRAIVAGEMGARGAPVPDPANLTRPWAAVPVNDPVGGYNDRGAAGSREAVELMFARMPLLWPTYHFWRGLVRANHSSAGWFPFLWAEMALYSVLNMHNMTVVGADLPFCIISHHRWPEYDKDGNPTFREMLPMTSLKTAVGGGHYCRPCPVNGTVECGPATYWEPDWEAQFEAQVDPDFAQQRRRVLSLPDSDCVATLEQMKSAMGRQCREPGGLGEAAAEPLGWSGPSPVAVCARRRLGRVWRQGLRGPHGWAWPLANFTRCNGEAPCVVYSLLPVLAGEQAEEATQGVLGAQLQLFRAGAMEDPEAGLVVLFSHTKPADVDAALERAAGQPGVALPLSVLRAFRAVESEDPGGLDVEREMQHRQHRRLQLLLIWSMDVAQRQVQAWSGRNRAPRACQLLLNVGSMPASTIPREPYDATEGEGLLQRRPIPFQKETGRNPGTAGQQWEAFLRQLRSVGLELVQCMPGPEELQGRCLFFNPREC